jgi:DNA replication protein DnaC
VSGRGGTAVPNLREPVGSASLLVTSNLPFREGGRIFQGERVTTALQDRSTHHCRIFEMNGESYCSRESARKSKSGQQHSS